NGEAAAKASSTLGGGALAPATAFSTSMAEDGRASAPGLRPERRTRKRRAPIGETSASRSTPPALTPARPSSPRRAAASAPNRLEAAAPVLGRRGAAPITSRQAALVVSR